MSADPIAHRPGPGRRTRRARRALPALLGLWLAAGAGGALAQNTTLARSLAATCANCHGTNGLSRGEVKSLAGTPADSIIATLAAFKSGAQPATIMNQIAKGYSDEQLRLIAEYFAAQPAPAK